MPWNSTTKKMVGAANINANGDIQKATGQSHRDIGNCIKYGCQGGYVNKWSRIKPIHYPGKDKLSLEDFKGTSDMITAGIVYGLQVPQGISSPTPSAIHATSWDYVGYPNASGMSGKSPYRHFDFIHPDTTPSEQTLVGYSANPNTGVPDISGQIPSGIPLIIGSSAATSVVYAHYDPGNTEGVKIAEYVVMPDAQTPISDLSAYLGRCYPGILIGSYLTALTHGDGDIAKPLYYNNAWVSDNWYVDMSKVLGKGTRKGYSPWTSTVNETASLVLIYPTSGNTTYIAAGDPETDIALYWIKLDDIPGGQAWNANFFPIPGATGVSVTLTKQTTSTVADITAITKTSTGFTVSYKFRNSYSGSLSITMQATATKPGTNIPRAPIRVVPHSSVNTSTTYTQTFVWSDPSDFDIMVSSGETYNVEVTISTKIGSDVSGGNGMQETITI